MADPISSAVRRIHDDAIVVDLHCDTAERLLDHGIDWGRRLPDGQLDLPRMREGGLDAQFFACWVDPDKAPPGRALRRALDLAVARHPDRIAMARTAAGVRRLAAEGRHAALLCVENGEAIEDNLDHLRALHAAGARYMTLTWMNHNAWADGSRDAPRHHGLTPFGREVVRAMNRLGMIVDVSHVSERTFWDAIETSTAPVIASHSNARAICDHHRNLTDAQLAAIGRTGGVVGVNYYAEFLSPAWKAAADAARAARAEAMKGWPAEVTGDPARLKAAKDAFWRERMGTVPRPPLEVLLRHLDHIAKVAGVDAVALGSDYDGAAEMAEGLEDCSTLPALTAALLARGYGEADVRKILGENALRVLERVVGG
jgi:membrane dipeptidase